jgi:hypothetical protein
MNYDVERKIDKLIEENIFRKEKIDDPSIANAIKNDYKRGHFSSFADSIFGQALMTPMASNAAGLYQGLRSGHPIVGLFGGKAATLGAASNNLKNISVGDAFTPTNVAGNLGIFAPVTALQYGLGKLFGSRMEAKDYRRKLEKMNPSKEVK